MTMFEEYKYEPFDPVKWYWVVQDTKTIYSGPANKYVLPDDEGFVEFVMSGKHIKSATTEKELIETLAVYNILPPFAVPASVKMWQAKVVLASQGLLDSIDKEIAKQDKSLQLAWEYASDLSRYSDGMKAMAKIIGLSDEQVDQLFIQAAKVKV